MSADDGPRPPDGSSTESNDLLTRFLNAERGPLMVLREVTVSVAAVAAVGLLLFAIGGVWPPMVAVESGSMEPHMYRGDLVFITDTARFPPDAAYAQTGVVPYRQGKEAGYRKFGDYGSVVVYDDPSEAGPPVIHRARFFVEKGENWYDRANPDYVSANSCVEMRNCPAPHAGFITKGDANGRYDQVNGISSPVKPSWVVGVARVRIPYLGWVRLGVSGTILDATPSRPGVELDAAPSTVAAGPAPTADAAARAT